jgi:aspartate/glutamate racemase
MKSIGLLGGTSWESTISEHRHINEAVARRFIAHAGPSAQGQPLQPSVCALRKIA